MVVNTATPTFPWQEFQSIHFERGISLEKTDTGSWRYLSSASSLEVSSPELAMKEYGVRPVVAFHMLVGTRVDMLLPARPGKLLEIYRTELVMSLPWSVAFAMGEMMYHTKALARWASALCADMAKDEIQDIGTRCIPPSEDAYFEFEALISSLTRGYEYIRDPLWNRYGKKGRTPKYFTDALNQADGIPPEIRDSLLLNYDGTYIPASDYRNCIHHIVDLGSTSRAMMERREPDVWTVLIRVPDNPKKERKEKFRFEGGLDALTLGWEYVTDFFALVDHLFGTASLNRIPTRGIRWERSLLLSPF